MKISKSLFSVVALVASFGVSASANAQLVTGSLSGGPIGVIRAFSAPMSCGACSVAGLATISGGSIIFNDQLTADIPAGSVLDNRFLSSGPSAGSPSTMTFTQSLERINFLWGSPDRYNTLTVLLSDGSSRDFTAESLMFPVTNGNQTFSQYVTFVAVPTVRITGLRFAATTDAFEAANFNTTVPEPSTYALMATGLLAIGGIASKRRKQA